MKLNKIIYILPALFFSFNVGNIYAQNDISNILFFDNTGQSTDIQSDILFDSADEVTFKQEIKNEIDIFTISSEKIVKKEADFILKQQTENKSNSEILLSEIKKQSLDFTTVSNDNTISDLISFSKTLLDTPYVYGGSSLKGFDCSGFVKYVFSNFDINLPRTTYQQIKQGTSVSIENIKEHDLIFFDTRSKEKLLQKSDNTSSSFDDIKINEKDTIQYSTLKPTEPTHVGIYIGNGKFIHASSSRKKVVIDELNSTYYINRIVDIKRYI